VLVEDAGPGSGLFGEAGSLTGLSRLFIYRIHSLSLMITTESPQEKPPGNFDDGLDTDRLGIGGTSKRWDGNGNQRQILDEQMLAMRHVSASGRAHSLTLSQTGLETRVERADKVMCLAKWGMCYKIRVGWRRASKGRTDSHDR
jgi:hypothetical protein